MVHPRTESFVDVKAMFLLMQSNITKNDSSSVLEILVMKRFLMLWQKPYPCQIRHIELQNG